MHNKNSNRYSTVPDADDRKHQFNTTKDNYGTPNRNSSKRDQRSFNARYNNADRSEFNDDANHTRADWGATDSTSRTPMDYSGRYSQDYEARRYSQQSDDSFLTRNDDQFHNQRYGYDKADTQVESHMGKGPKNYKRSMEKINEDVCEALLEHSMIDASEIEVNVSEGGIVTLTGTVDTRANKRLAEECAESVKGVTDVHNQLSARTNMTSSSQVNTQDSKKMSSGSQKMATGSASSSFKQ